MDSCVVFVGVVLDRFFVGWLLFVCFEWLIDWVYLGLLFLFGNVLVLYCVLLFSGVRFERAGLFFLFGFCRCLGVVN